jgi:hypothetical protein
MPAIASVLLTSFKKEIYYFICLEEVVLRLEYWLPYLDMFLLMCCITGYLRYYVITPLDPALDKNFQNTNVSLKNYSRILRIQHLRKSSVIL